jgi:type IV secretion system protein VirD4
MEATEMYLLSRFMLILAVALLAYCIVLGTILGIKEQVPPDKQGLVSAILIVGLIAALARKKGRWLFTSGGTASWTSNAELKRAGMLGATSGLILGRINSVGVPLTRALKALVNVWLSPKDACREFFANLSWRKRKEGSLVRLPQAVHTLVVAPTGVGKGVSCIVPFLLTCEESCVVVDFKGENALLTAEHRRRMGHKIVILDPFKVVTQ